MSLPLYPSLPVPVSPVLQYHHLAANRWLCTSRWNWLQEGSIPLYHACLSTAPPLPNASCPSLFCSATKPTKTWNSLGTDFSVLLDPSDSSKPLFKMYKYIIQIQIYFTNTNILYKYKYIIPNTNIKGLGKC